VLRKLVAEYYETARRSVGIPVSPGSVAMERFRLVLEETSISQNCVAGWRSKFTIAWSITPTINAFAARESAYVCSLLAHARWAARKFGRSRTG